MDPAQPHPGLSRPRYRPSLSAWTWRLGSVAAITAAILFLGACTLQDDSDASPAGNSPIPQPTQVDATTAASTDTFGRCWNEAISVINPAATAWGSPVTGNDIDAWTGGDPVPCDGEHTSYTFAVEDIPADSKADVSNAVPVDSVATTNAGSGDAATAICDEAFRKLFPTHVHEQRRIHWFAFTPPDAERQAGARWVRCDVALLAIGTPTTAAAVAALPANIHDLAADLAAHPRSYNYCVTAPGNGGDEGPLEAAEPVVADCTVDARWEYIGSEPIAGIDGTATPTDEQLRVAAQQTCRETAQRQGVPGNNALLYRPSAEDWRAGQQTVTCWSILR